VLLYSGLSILATWPLVLHFDTHVPGADTWGATWVFSESRVNLWNLWWFRHAIVDLHQNPFECLLVFYPVGANLWFHTLAPLSGLVALGLQTVLSLTASQNVLVLASLVLSAVCARALALRLGVPENGARLAGAVFAFSPPVFAHLYAGHYEVVSVFWLPLALLLFLRVVDLGRLRDGVLLGLVLGACAYAVQYYVVYALELLLVAAAVLWRRTFRPAPLRALLAGAIFALVLAAPLLRVFLTASADDPTPFDGFEVLSGDLLSFVVPSFEHPLLAEPFASVRARLSGDFGLPQETTMFLGWTTLALAIVGVVWRRRERKGVALVCSIVAFSFLLALGSHLKIGGNNTGLPLPAMLLGRVPVLEQARAPGRHVVIVMLGLGILAGAGYAATAGRRLHIVLPLLIAFEFAGVPFPLTATAASPAHQRLAQIPGDYAVLDLPLQVRDGHQLLGALQTDQTLGQMAHGHPIVGGMVSRQRPEVRQEIKDMPVIGTLLHPVGATPEAIARDIRDGAGFLLRHRIFVIAVQPSAVGSPQQQYLLQILPVVSQERIADGAMLYWLRDPATLAIR
jgi:hypothetical protein